MARHFLSYGGYEVKHLPIPLALAGLATVCGADMLAPGQPLRAIITGLCLFILAFVIDNLCRPQ